MTKRIASILMCIMMLISVMSAMPAMAATKEGEVKNLFYNGDIETVIGTSIPNWTQKGNWELSAEIKHGGNNAIKGTDDGTNYYYISQTVKVIPGETYDVEGYCYIEDAGEGYPAVKVEMYTETEDGKTEYTDKKESNYTELSPKKWNKVGFSVKAPENVTVFIVMFRMNHGKVFYYDDMSITGPAPAVGEPLADKNYVKLPEGQEELLTNASFEELDENGFPKNWEAYQGWSETSEKVRLNKNGGYDGNNTVDVMGGGNPWVRQLIYRPFRQGEVYQLSVWYRIQSAGALGFKCEWHDENDVYIEGNNTETTKKVTGEQWVQYVYHMEIPYDCERISLYIRNFAEGKIEIDSASFYRIKAPAPVFINTDEIFYYTEEANAGKYGHIEAKINQEAYPDLVGLPVTFRIKDADKVIYEKAGVMPKDLLATHDFRISVLAEEWKQYTLEVAVTGADGKDIAAESISIYKYPRPTVLNERGKVVLADGKELNPTMWYHVEIADYAKLAAAGGTVVQSRYETPDGILNCLDAAQKNGLMVMAALYRGMLPAGHQNNVENTTTIIEKVKDHPALLGYMVMDEPSSNFANKLNLFEDSYKLIRTLDPKHIVYTVEASPFYYPVFAKYVDVFAIDPYPGYVKGGAPVDHVLKYNEQAQNTIGYEKPIWCINQATGFENLVPGEMDIRNMFYQALYSGATAVGQYAWYDKTEWMDNKMFPETEALEGMTNLYTGGEAELAYAHFVDRKFPIFKEQSFDDYWVSSYVRGKDVYMYIVNRDDEKVDVSIPLVSDGGAVTIGDYTANIVYGDTNVNSVRVGNGTLEFSLDGNGAYLFKITPSAPADFSALKTTKYRDLYVTPWAAEAIRLLEEKGIVNDNTATSYAPQKKITRGEFAYFLIRTLGLTSDATENFVDVASDAFYAKELAIGKALGILNGVGDNKYNPEAEISRQDLMTIIARGMNLTGETDLTAFSDGGMVADYAVAHVKAMIATGLIKGNADGTINPLGNATRAEAAVIMERILKIK